MFLSELAQQAPLGYSTEKDDNSVQKLTDLRKTRLTLGHLNKLRMANDVRKFEHEKKVEQVTKQYSPAPEAGAGGLGL
jgi:hypothetical protein